MDIKIRKTSGNYDGREVPYTELEVLGDKHTLSVRKYPRNVSVVMWKNSDKRGTRVSLKMPHDKFFFVVHVNEVVGNFETELSYETIILLENKWEEATEGNSF